MGAAPDSGLITWLLGGDVSVRYQTYRDLLDDDRAALQARIETEGWGRRFLRKQGADGHWGQGFYRPKWTATHYTLLDLKHLDVSPGCAGIPVILSRIGRDLKGPDGGIYPIGRERASDVCVNGMFLNYAVYFRVQEAVLRSVVDFLLGQHMEDGGFNCRSNRSGARHSSLHTTISVLEGITEYIRGGYRYRARDLRRAAAEGGEFLLQHRLFRSDRTGEIIDPKMLMLSWPSRWRYDILRALDYFRAAGAGYDPRMEEAVAILLKKKRADGRWPLQARHSGRTHFEMEQTGQASRANTLRALRVLRHLGVDPHGRGPG